MKDVSHHTTIPQTDQCSEAHAWVCILGLCAVNLLILMYMFSVTVYAFTFSDCSCVTNHNVGKTQSPNILSKQMTPVNCFILHGINNLPKVFVGANLSRCQKD